MIRSQDNMRTFIPKKAVRLVILGTMGSISARDVGDDRAENPFFYHSPYNHFWRVLQSLYFPDRPVQKFSVAEKKQFLQEQGIAIANIVQEIRIPDSQAKDPSDSIIFSALKRDHVIVKNVSRRFKNILNESPLFFTCRSKPGILKLLDRYWQKNKLRSLPKKRVCFLPSPTRCNPHKRAQQWSEEMDRHWNSSP